MECEDELQEVNNIKSSLDREIAAYQKDLVNKNNEIKAFGDKSSNYQKIIDQLEKDFTKQLNIAENARKELKSINEELRSCEIDCGIVPSTKPTLIIDQTEVNELKEKIKVLEKEKAEAAAKSTCDPLDEDEKLFKDAFSTDFYYRSY